MHPALSVIFLTTLIGAGQGLFLALFTAQLYGLAGLLPVQGGEFYWRGSLIALILLVLGLFASFFHLGRPERAWRAASRWRTSWLSREVIALPLTLALVAAYGLAHWAGADRPLFALGGTVPVDGTLLLGALGTVAAFALYLCTAMIYASLRFLEEWHSPLTVVNFTLFGIGSGFLLAAAYSAWLGNGLLVFFGNWAAVATLLALTGRLWSMARNAGLKRRSSVQSAIGVRHRSLAQKSQGATGGSFNTREFFHGAGAGTLRALRLAFLVLVFPVPVALVAAAYGLDSPALPIAAFALQYLGLLAERWSFFAEATHPQNHYYRAVS
jgi:DMSO reductase anchor subunit